MTIPPHVSRINTWPYSLFSTLLSLENSLQSVLPPSALHLRSATKCPLGRWIRTGKLRAGKTVLLDYYALAPVYDGTAASCLTHPAVRDYMEQNMAAMTQFNSTSTDSQSRAEARFSGYLLSYDEMRTGHTCELCASHGATAGELLAEHLKNASAIARQAAGPERQLFMWDDMFNPFHNAHDDYFLIVSFHGGALSSHCGSVKLCCSYAAAATPGCLRSRC